MVSKVWVTVMGDLFEGAQSWRPWGGLVHESLQRFYRLQGTAVGFRQAARAVSGVIAKVEEDVREGVLDALVAGHVIRYLRVALGAILGLAQEVDLSGAKQEGKLELLCEPISPPTSMIPQDRGKTVLLPPRSAVFSGL